MCIDFKMSFLVGCLSKRHNTKQSENFCQNAESAKWKERRKSLLVTAVWSEGW